MTLVSSKAHCFPVVAPHLEIQAAQTVLNGDTKVVVMETRSGKSKGKLI